jgi:Mg-chelatase subunit ChlD
VERLEADPRLPVKASLADTLKAITQKDFGFDFAAWRAWLAQQEVPEGERTAITVARYYGRAIVADDVCFVVDDSGSMLTPKTKPGSRRIDVARGELLRALDSLDERTRFNVVAFSSEAEIWKRSGSVPATEANVKAARGWVEKRFVANGETNTSEALRLAYECNPDVDTIFLLSDGSPSLGVYQSDIGILCAIRARHWNRRCVIHTIVLTLDDLLAKNARGGTDFGEQLMRRIAEDTGGECRVVTRPPAPAPAR